MPLACTSVHKSLISPAWLVFVAQPCLLLSLSLCGHWRSSLFKFLRWVFFDFIGNHGRKLSNDLTVLYHSLAPLFSLSSSICGVISSKYFFGGGNVDFSAMFQIWCADHLMLNRNPFDRDTSLTIISKSNHSNAVVSGQGGKTASAVRLLSFSCLAQW